MHCLAYRYRYHLCTGSVYASQLPKAMDVTGDSAGIERFERSTIIVGQVILLYMRIADSSRIVVWISR